MRDLYRKHKRPQMRLKTAGQLGSLANIETTGTKCYVTQFSTTQTGAGTSVVLRNGDSSTVWVVVHGPANSAFQYNLAHPLETDGLEVAVSAGTGRWSLIYYVED